MKKAKRTNYRKRLDLLKSGLPRLVVRKTDSAVIAHIVEFNQAGDKTIAMSRGTDLKKFGWTFSGKNSSAAYLVGYLLGKRANVKEAILDKGNRTLKQNSFIYYVMKGLNDFGVDVHSDDIKIDEKRLYGEHISSYYADRKGNQFSLVGEKIKNIREDFNKTLENIKNGK
jgi:large subunit ribosomal protein L18